MKWLGNEDMAVLLPRLDGYHDELLTRSEIPAFISAIKAWYPDITVGAASCYLNEDFYTNCVCLEDAPDKNISVILTKRGNELAGMLSLEREGDAKSLYGRLGIVNPAHRGTKLGLRFAQTFEIVGRAMGMEIVHALVTLKVPYMQRAFERMGYRLLGFTPGYDGEMVAPGIVKRVYEAAYAKVLVSEDELLRPDPQNLTFKTKALFDVMFPATA